LIHARGTRTALHSKTAGVSFGQTYGSFGVLLDGSAFLLIVRTHTRHAIAAIRVLTTFEEFFGALSFDFLTKTSLVSTLDALEPLAARSFLVA